MNPQGDGAPPSEPKFLMNHYKSSGFHIPQIIDHATGWGPAEYEPSDLGKLQFIPFDKGDKLSHISDWNQSSHYQRRLQQFSGGSNVFNYEHVDNESEFLVIDRAPKPKVRKHRRKGFQQQRNRRFQNRRGRFQQQGVSQRGGRTGVARRTNKKRNLRHRGRRHFQEEQKKDPSVVIKEEWKLASQLEISSLRVGLDPGQGETLESYGEIREYDVSYSRINPRNPVDLKAFKEVFSFATTSVDPVIKRLAGQKKGNIFMTDTIAAVLMTTPQSAHSWDVVVTKRDGMIYFDKRGNSRMDFLTVNENWHESKETDAKNLNHVTKLSEEATWINHNFISQVLTAKAQKFDRSPLFNDLGAADGVPAPIAYHYRKWSLGGNRELIVRCEINGYETRKDKKEYFVSRAINEWTNSRESGNLDYRTKLESQAGAVLAAEMKNNASKLAKWTVKALLSGADQLKLGYVTRANVRSNHSHQVLLVQRHKPDDFAKLMQIKPVVFWGTLSKIVSAINELDDGNYLILRDPNEQLLHIHSIPEDAFDGDFDDDDDGADME